ncbi:MAG: hypothetical protein N2517_00690 [Ignavibacteria bacterium]|nr:hypothetical protein [Ignavibacteria bacterium]
MELSKDTKEVLTFLDYTSGNSLRKREDLGSLLELLAQRNLPELANELIFVGSSLWSTYRSLKTHSDKEISENLTNELENLFDKFSKLLIEVIQFSDESFFSRVEKVYLSHTLGARRNIIDLCYDLNEVKKLQNRLRAFKDDKNRT